MGDKKKKVTRRGTRAPRPKSVPREKPQPTDVERALELTVALMESVRKARASTGGGR